LSEHLLKSTGSSSQKIERILAIFALVTIVIAWFVGFFKTEADLVPRLSSVLPEADRFELVGSRVYTAWSGETNIGYIGIGAGNGYGGAMNVAVAVDSSSSVINLAIVEHRETYSFLSRVVKNKFLDIFIGKLYSNPITLGDDIEAVTGATYTSRAVTDAVRHASRNVAERVLRFSVPPEPSPKIQFGIPEIILILLYVTGFTGRKGWFKQKKIIRWISMLTGLAVLGFMYNSPLTLAFINKLLLGFFPNWQTHLYWYLLIGGILFVFTIDNKNPYCEWFCPFGAAQECFGLIGGAKARTPVRFRVLFRWLQRGLAWLAIILALLFRNPSISTYEVFGTLFELIGSSYQFALLGIVLIASLYIKRPWCSYLCPLRPVTDLIRLIRNWVIELWPTHRPQKAV